MPVNKINSTSISNSNTNNTSNIKSSHGAQIGQTFTANSFQDVMKNTRLELFNGTMNELLDIVKNRGQEFLRSPQEESLYSYKESVKYFLNKIREEFLSLKEEFGVERDGEQRVYQLVDTAGGQAEALTREAFTKDDALNLLTSLDEIRGLVLDVIG